jgi:hypothetical protein
LAELIKKKNLMRGQTPLSRSHVSSMSGGSTYPVNYHGRVVNVENGTLLHQLVLQLFANILIVATFFRKKERKINNSPH